MRFNPRLPGGRRRQIGTLVFDEDTFQSTPSGGKATLPQTFCGGVEIGFNPRLPGGRRPTRTENGARVDRVSIHAFRGEGDRQRSKPFRQTAQFQSTPSGGKATL